MSHFLGAHFLLHYRLHLPSQTLGDDSLSPLSCVLILSCWVLAMTFCGIESLALRIELWWGGGYLLTQLSRISRIGWTKLMQQCWVIRLKWVYWWIPSLVSISSITMTQEKFLRSPRYTVNVSFSFTNGTLVSTPSCICHRMAFSGWSFWVFP